MEQISASRKEFTGTNAERLALQKTTLNAKDTFIESDTGDEFIFDGNGSLGNWRQTHTAGKTNTLSTSSFGDHPANNTQIIGPISTTLAAALTVTGVQGMHSGRFTISGLTGETVTVTALAESGNSMGDFHLRETGTPATIVDSTARGNGTYLIEGTFVGSAMVFTKSAAVETVTIEGLMSGAA